MLKSIYFGKYIPGNSILHKVDARTKIITSLLIFIMVFYLKEIIPLLIIFFGIIIFILASSISPKEYIKTLRPILLISIFTSLVNFIFELQFKNTGNYHFDINTIKNSTVIFMRLVSMTLSSSAMMFTTSPSDISLSLKKLFFPLKFFGINCEELALTITISLRFIPILLEEANNIILAQKARGIFINTRNPIKKIKMFSAIVIPLFLSSFKKAEKMALSIDARCYDSTKPRSEFKILKFKFFDLLFMLYITLILLGAYLCNYKIAA